MQWNANGICPKLLELCDKIINSVSDIVATPESKLRKADKTPSIEGYSTIHKDWNNILGSGLLFFIYNGMIFEKLQSLKKNRHGNLIHLGPHIKIIMDWDLQHIHPQHHN